MNKRAVWKIVDVAAWGLLGAGLLAWRGTAPLPPPPPRVRKLRQLTFHDWRDILVRTFKEIQRDKLTIVSGGVTFSVLLAIFPTLAAFVSLYGLFADVEAVREQIGVMSRFMPPGVVELIGEQMIRLATANDSALGAALMFSVALAVWSANSGMGAMFDGLNFAYGERESRKWWKRRLVSLACTATGLILLIVVSTVTAALPAWLDALGFAPAELWWLPFTWIAVLAIIVTALAGLYRFGPNHTAPAWRAYWPGAIAAAVLWLAGSAAFSAYVSQFGNYEKTYGSLGAVIGFMVWIWCSALAVLAGAELNSEIERPV